MAEQTRLDIILSARDRVSAQLKRVNGALSSTFAQMAGGAAVMAGLSAAMRDFVRDVQQASRATAEFEQTLTPLFSLGRNVENIKAIREEVLAMSTGWGRARDQIARAMFDLQSGTANLAKAQQEELMASALQLAEVYGAELPVALRNLVKVYQIYGDQMNDVNAIQSKLAFLAEEGFLTFEEMASQLPDVASAADAMGASLNDVLAALVVATQRGGKTEATFTAIRNVFLRMNKAEEEGIRLSGSFVDKLRQINEHADAELLKKIFGDEAIAGASNLLSATEQIEDVLDRLSNKLPDVGEKLATRMEDTASQFAAIAEVLKQLEQNQMLGASPEAIARMQQFEAAGIGLEQFQRENPALGLGSRLPGFSETGAALDIGGELSRDALTRALEAALNSNNLELAEALADRLEKQAEGQLIQPGFAGGQPDRVMSLVESARALIESQRQAEAQRAERSREQQEAARREQEVRGLFQGLPEDRVEELVQEYKSLGEGVFLHLETGVQVAGERLREKVEQMVDERQAKEQLNERIKEVGLAITERAQEIFGHQPTFLERLAGEQPREGELEDLMREGRQRLFQFLFPSSRRGGGEGDADPTEGGVDRRSGGVDPLVSRFLTRAPGQDVAKQQLREQQQATQFLKTVAEWTKGMKPEDLRSMLDNLPSLMFGNIGR